MPHAQFSYPYSVSFSFSINIIFLLNAQQQQNSSERSMRKKNWRPYYQTVAALVELPYRFYDRFQCTALRTHQKYIWYWSMIHEFRNCSKFIWALKYHAYDWRMHLFIYWNLKYVYIQMDICVCGKFSRHPHHKSQFLTILRHSANQYV